MGISMRFAVTSVALLALAACSKDEPKPTSTPASASAAPVDPASASASVAPTASLSPAASASAAPSGPVHECPKGTVGDGTFDKPCEATKTARMMEAHWTGKTDDKGPYFAVTNKSKETILFGRIGVYFYDKAGKQLDVPDDGSGKPAPFRTCSGNIFSGVMKPGEKATLTFSCVSKKHVPEGTAAIEAEMQGVGFVDPSDEKKVTYYWRNKDLTPDARKKGAK